MSRSVLMKSDRWAVTCQKDVTEVVQWWGKFMRIFMIYTLLVWSLWFFGWIDGFAWAKKKRYRRRWGEVRLSKFKGSATMDDVIDDKKEFGVRLRWPMVMEWFDGVPCKGTGWDEAFKYNWDKRWA